MSLVSFVVAEGSNVDDVQLKVVTTRKPVPLVAVKLTPVGRAQSFLLGDVPPDSPPRTGDRVVVQTENGQAVGTVVRAIHQLDEKRRLPDDSPQRVVRLATRDDIVTRLKHQHREQEAFRIATLKVRERGLGMKLTRAEQTFDGSKLIFFFTADGRVDFRELVRELASEFRTRIEMRQIGVRDEAKMIGGYGTCGRPLCCTTRSRRFHSRPIRSRPIRSRSGCRSRPRCRSRHAQHPSRSAARTADSTSGVHTAPTASKDSSSGPAASPS